MIKYYISISTVFSLPFFADDFVKKKAFYHEVFEGQNSLGLSSLASLGCHTDKCITSP